MNKKDGFWTFHQSKERINILNPVIKPAGKAAG